MTTWRVVESFGDSELVARLTDQAITMASVTGSVGASYSESDTNGNTIAFAEVERTKA
jgi:hypothetical protein